jgi:tungstate transport system permease protein
MKFLWQGFREAWHLIITGNPDLYNIIWVTLKVAALSTAIAVVIGIPIGVWIGLGRFRGHRFALVLANSGLILPPVLIGLVLSLLMFPEAPLGRFHLLFTLKGVYVAQTVLAVPIVIALTSSSVRAVPTGLLAQARAFDANTVQVWTLAIREARIGVLTGIIAAIGSALSEVGAVVLVGGNIEHDDQTLASAALASVGAARFSDAMAIGVVLFGLILIVVAALTFLQRGEGHLGWVRQSS